jgi:tRNA(Ile)-lysidine synthase TilS/MesJ
MFLSRFALEMCVACAVHSGLASLYLIHLAVSHSIDVFVLSIDATHRGYSPAESDQPSHISLRAIGARRI